MRIPMEGTTKGVCTEESSSCPKNVALTRQGMITQIKAVVFEKDE